MINKKTRRLSYQLFSNILVFLSVLSFFCSDLSINTIFTIKPFYIVALITVIFLLFHKKIKFIQLSKVDKAFVLFFIFSFVSAIFSPFSITNSLKHILGIILLACSFYVFKILYSSYDQTKLSKLVTAAGITIIIITIIWYLIGLFQLNFNFNIKDVWCFGVRVDRKIPRLISFAYNEPNYVSIYFSILFSFFTSRKRSIFSTLGMIGSLLIIILTISRGGYIALTASLFIYIFFAKETIKEKLFKIAVMATTIACALASITAIMNANPNSATAHNVDNGMSSHVAMLAPSEASKMELASATEHITAPSDTPNAKNKSAINTIIERFQKSFKDNGSNRLIHWEDSIKTFIARPLLGIGTGNIIEYNDTTYGRRSPTHNSYLDVLAEQGVIGTVAYIAMIFIIIVQCWKVRKQSIAPAMGFAFLLVSELFLSLAITELLFINILMLDMVILYSERQNNLAITNLKKDHHNKHIDAIKNPKLSFIVPIYNTEQYIDKCLTSLVVQSGISYEIIIVNDGSTDNSEKICKKYVSSYKNIHYFKTKNNGLSAARNYGINKASGKYIWFVDSDDFIAQNSLKTISKNLKHDIVTINYYNYYNDYDISPSSIFKSKDPIINYYINPAMATLKIIKRNLLIKNHISFAIGKAYEDVALMYLLPKYTKDIFNSDEKLYFYRRRNDSISAIFSEKNFTDHIWAVKQLNNNKIKEYSPEIEYQTIMQILFMVFDISKKSCPKYADYFSAARKCLLKNCPNYNTNKYLSKKTKKNIAYKIYLSKMVNEKYNSCAKLNTVRQIITKGV